MRRTSLITLVIALAIAPVGCTSPVTISPDGPRAVAKSVEAGSPFDLRVGEEAAIAGTDVRIRFDGVRQDSRCPSNVQCVWAGDAEAAFRITTPAGSTDLVLHTNGQPRSANAGGHLIRLESVRPHPAEGSSIPPDEYIVTLAVSAP